MNITGFDKVAPYLTNPLVLAGFGLMLAYGIHWQLMKSGLLAQATKKDSALIIRLFLRYGFWLALVLLLAGFGLQFSGIGLSAWNSYMDKEKEVAKEQQFNIDELAEKVAEKVLAKMPPSEQGREETKKAVIEAVTALPKTGAPVKSINDALQALEQGHTDKAKAIFAEVLKSKEAEGKQANKEAAAAARHLGALAYMNNPKEALVAYQKAVQLDPDNAADWTWLGNLLRRTGELAQAEEAFHKVLALAEAHQDKKEQTWAYGNLGLVYQTRGELDKAEEMHRKALELDKALGSKEGMAEDYGNLGVLYEKHGNLKQAEAAWKKSLSLFQTMGHPNAEKVQQWLDDLAEQRTTSTQ